MKTPVYQLADYATSTDLYTLFSTDYLRSRVRAASVTTGMASDVRVNALIGQVVADINFGTVSHVPHQFVNGTSGNLYPTQLVTTPLKGFRLGVLPPAGVALPRAVITAGMHPREVAPPMATGRFFSELVVSYLVGQLLPNAPGVPLVHPGFRYLAGPRHVFDVAGHDITKPVKKDADENLGDAGFTEPVNVRAHTISAADVISMMTGLEIIVLPVCNPAGLDFVLTQVPGESEVDNLVRRNWRKNRAPINTDLCPDGTVASQKDSLKGLPGDASGEEYFAIGVDINRNADFIWHYRRYYTPQAGQEPQHGCTRDPYDFESYIGAGPNSELETRAVLATLLSAWPGMDTYPQLLRPSLTQGVLTPHEEDDNEAAFLDALRPAPTYLGPLFYLDIHAQSRSIFVPWACETASIVGLAQSTNSSTQLQDPRNRQLRSYLNPFFDQKDEDETSQEERVPVRNPDGTIKTDASGNVVTKPTGRLLNYLNTEKRDGVSKLRIPDRSRSNVAYSKDSVAKNMPGSTLLARHDTYQEFFPEHLTFANQPSQYSHNLLKAHVEDFGGPMKAAIVSSLRANVDPASVVRMGRRSEYSVGQSTGLYTISGTPSDYAFALNLQNIPNFLTPLQGAGGYSNTLRTGPVIALAVEMGHAEDGEFMPLDLCWPRKKTPLTMGQYAKVERETYAAIHSFLMQSIRYAAL